jgi:hypothetical protein
MYGYLIAETPGPAMRLHTTPSCYSLPITVIGRKPSSSHLYYV